MNGTRWQRDELLLALNLYCRLPFGRQNSTTPEIIELAGVLGRTPSSVAMKLSNFTSLDPVELARGIKGLVGASQLDREVWAEFRGDQVAVAVASEGLWQERVEGRAPAAAVMEYPMPGGPAPELTETTAPRRIRLAQDFFRRSVLAVYGGRCCITGLGVPGLLVASHIVPWCDRPESRTDPSNGLCLSALHDAAFDRHLITLDDAWRVVLGAGIRGHLEDESVRENFVRYEGRAIRLPEKFEPNRAFLAEHRRRTLG